MNLLFYHVPAPNEALVIAGAKDPLALPQRVKRDCAGAIAGALFVLLRDAGHNLPIEAPDEIATAIRQFQ